MFDQIQLTIGHNVNGTPAHTIQHVCSMVEAFLNVEAYTAIPCYGMWKGTPEDSTRIEIVAEADTLAIIHDNIAYLAHALDQEAIMCAYAGSYEFITPETPAIVRIAA